VQQLVGAAARATRRGTELTGKLLAFSRRQVLQPTVVDTAALLHSLTDMLRRTLDQRIVITLDAEEVLCMADPGQLESALLNVAINARDAMPQGGTLGFTCRAVPRLPPELDAEGGTAESEGYVAISIADTGEGMSEAVKERAFEPFFTTKESGRGTGLGLSTVYGFARQSNGAVTLQSAEGQGTTLELFLPRSMRQQEPEAEAPAAPVPGTAAPRTVLFVEDDELVRAVLAPGLRTSGFQVITAVDAASALDVLRKHHVDIVFSDIVMPGRGDGFYLAEEIRKIHPELPIVLATGYSDALTASSPFRILLKPYTLEAARVALERELRTARHDYVQPAG